MKKQVPQIRLLVVGSGELETEWARTHADWQNSILGPVWLSRPRTYAGELQRGHLVMLESTN